MSAIDTALAGQKHLLPNVYLRTLQQVALSGITSTPLRYLFPYILVFTSGNLTAIDFFTTSFKLTWINTAYLCCHTRITFI